MRINKFLALHTNLSRRAADTAILNGTVCVNGEAATPGLNITDDDIVTLAGQVVKAKQRGSSTILLLNKPVGYVCSRNGQGSQTIFDLLPTEFKNLQSVGRLDKDSSGLLVMTDDGQLAHELTHPKFQKEKLYEVKLDRELDPEDEVDISDGIELEDGLSLLNLHPLEERNHWHVRMHEGRNRQIRRTFAAKGYKVLKLHRLEFGIYRLSQIENNKYLVIRK